MIAEEVQEVYLEELLPGGRTVDTYLQFEPLCLTIKNNQYGTRGLFTTKPISSGASILSVNTIGCSLSSTRAFDEAKDLLEPLGIAKYHLSDWFLITCALYLRYQDSPADLYRTFGINDETLDFYARSPMACSPYVEYSKIALNNNSEIARQLEEQEAHVEKLQIDKTLFGSLFAIVKSRGWEDYGLIPGLDLSNASTTANMKFTALDGKLQFIADRDIKAGEELTWAYNQADALSTWLNYGYVDNSREHRALLLSRLSDDQIDAFCTFAIAKLGCSRNDVILPLAIDKNMFKTYLPCFGPDMRDKHRKQLNMSRMMGAFDQARGFYRSLIVAFDQIHDLDHSALNREITPLGLSFDIKAMNMMLDALRRANNEIEMVAQSLNQTPQCRNIDLQPGVDIQKTASRYWIEVIGLLIKLYREEDPTDVFKVISEFTGKEIDQRNAKAFYEKSESEAPCLALSLSFRHLTARGLI